MTHSIYMTLAATGNTGKTTIARHVLAPDSGPIATLETHSASGDETDVLDRGGLAARLFAPPTDGLVLDVGVGDTVDALEALRLISQQDSGLPSRLRLVVPMLTDSKSVAGLRLLLDHLPVVLRPCVRAIWNRVRHTEGATLKDSDVARAARSVARQGGAQLCSVPLRESALFDPAHALVRRYGSIAALASLPDSTIREAALGEMSTLLVARDAAQAAVANCREVYAALAE